MSGCHWLFCLHKIIGFMAVDIVPEKVEMINNRKSPIQDDYIERYLVEKVLESYSNP